MLDPRLVEDAANRLDTDEGLVEKDWHVVRAISVIASLDERPVNDPFQRKCARLKVFAGFWVTSLNGYHSRTTWNFHAGVQVIGPGRFRFAKDPFTKARHQRVSGRFKR